MQYKKYSKAIAAFVVAYISSLVALVNAGIAVQPKVLLLALGTAIVTTYGAYQAPRNKEN